MRSSFAPWRTYSVGDSGSHCPLMLPMVTEAVAFVHGHSFSTDQIRCISGWPSPSIGELGSMTAPESKDGIVFTENLHTVSSVLDLRVTYHTDSSANGVQVTAVL